MFSREGGFPLLAGTLKAAAVVVGLGYMMAHWMSSGSWTANGSGGSVAYDPMTTGSIGDVPRLDPCRLEPRTGGGTRR